MSSHFATALSYLTGVNVTRFNFKKKTSARVLIKVVTVEFLFTKLSSLTFSFLQL